MLHPFLHRAEHADTPRHRARPLRPTRRVCYFYLICASVPHVPHMHRCRLRQCAAQQRRMTRSAAPPRQSAQAPGRPPHSPGHWRARAGGGQAVSAPLRSDDSCDADDASPCRRRATRRHKHTTTSPRLTRHGWPRQGRRHSRRQGRRRTATAQPGRGTRHPAPNRSNARPQQAAPGFPWAGWASWPAGPALGSQASGLQPPNRLRLTARPRRRSSQCHESRHPSPNAVWRLSSSPPPPPPSPPPPPVPAAVWPACRNTPRRRSAAGARHACLCVCAPAARPRRRATTRRRRPASPRPPAASPPPHTAPCPLTARTAALAPPHARAPQMRRHTDRNHAPEPDGCPLTPSSSTPRRRRRAGPRGRFGPTWPVRVCTRPRSASCYGEPRSITAARRLPPVRG